MMTPNDDALRLTTPRLVLEPVLPSHALELHELFSDAQLHRFVPSDVLTLDEALAKCTRWAPRHSPDGQEIWLNWLARERQSQRVVGHFQAGVALAGDRVARLGWLLATAAQCRGLATEALTAVLAVLRDALAVREVKAWADSRNVASHRLAQRLGLVQVAVVRDADFFKGATSDEFVFARVLAAANQA